jgi:hypothetical protein
MKQKHFSSSSSPPLARGRPAMASRPGAPPARASRRSSSPPSRLRTADGTGVAGLLNGFTVHVPATWYNLTYGVSCQQHDAGTRFSTDTVLPVPYILVCAPTVYICTTLFFVTARGFLSNRTFSCGALGPEHAVTSGTTSCRNGDG